MKIFSRQISLLIFAATVTPLMFGAPTTSGALIVHDSKVWTISKDGHIEALPFQFEGGNEVDHQGTSSPVPSHDQSLIAYTKDNDLWILSPRDNSNVRVTRCGLPGDSDSTSVYVLITAWSFDSKSLLYYVTHSDPETFEEAGADLEIPSAPYGYRIYDLATKSSVPVKLPGDFEAWLPNGEFLLTSVEPELFDQRLLRFKVGDEFPQLLSPLKGAWGQTSLSPDGKYVLIAFSEAKPKADFSDIKAQMDDGPQMQSRIVKMSIKSNFFTNASADGFWSEYQMPSFSPSGKHIAYIQQQELDSNGYIRGKLVVDGRPSADFHGLPFVYHWVDDESVAMMEENMVVVVDVASGKELGHSHFNEIIPTLSATPVLSQ